MQVWVAQRMQYWIRCDGQQSVSDSSRQPMQTMGDHLMKDSAGCQAQAPPSCIRQLDGYSVCCLLFMGLLFVGQACTLQPVVGQRTGTCHQIVTIMCDAC